FVFIIAILLLAQSSWATWEEEEQKSISFAITKSQQGKHKEKNKVNLDDCPQQASSEEKITTLSTPQHLLGTDQAVNSNDALIKTFFSSAKLVDPVDVLPVELLIHVSAFLDLRDLGKLPELSKRWQVMASTPDLWRHVGLTRYVDYLKG